MFCSFVLEIFLLDLHIHFVHLVHILDICGHYRRCTEKRGLKGLRQREWDLASWAYILTGIAIICPSNQNQTTK